MQQYLTKTNLLDFDSSPIQTLLHIKKWDVLTKPQAAEQIYIFVQNEIKFGFNATDKTTASQVLLEGYGQCNTKSILFMALLRAVGIPCRMHAFFVDKSLQKGVLKGFYYKFAPQQILHGWVEVYLQDKWIDTEGIILDKNYLQALQSKFGNCKTDFCGFGVATDSFEAPPVDWTMESTYIQRDGIIEDLGRFGAPDDMLAKHEQHLFFIKDCLYRNIVRHSMNRNVAAIRQKNGQNRQ